MPDLLSKGEVVILNYRPVLRFADVFGLANNLASKQPNSLASYIPLQEFCGLLFELMSISQKSWRGTIGTSQLQNT